MGTNNDNKENNDNNENEHQQTNEKDLITGHLTPKSGEVVRLSRDESLKKKKEEKEEE